MVSCLSGHLSLRCYFQALLEANFWAAMLTF
jgi:hypothetical protein